MADKRRSLDVWIVETNTVYKEVPYTIATDWVQQGRLLGDDKLRYSGTEKWTRLGDVPAFVAFLPKAEPFRVEDKAEALEPVQVDFAWKHRPGQEDDDVDMIPLIDVSLVLLIFFMLTATVSTAASAINTPQAENKLLTNEPGNPWIGIDQDKEGTVVYTLGKGAKGDGKTYATQDEVLRALQDDVLVGLPGPADLIVRANRNLKCELIVQDLALELDKFKRRGKLADYRAEVSEKKTP